MIDNMAESRIYWLLAQAQYRALSKEETTELEELSKDIDDPKLADDVRAIWRLSSGYATSWKPDSKAGWLVLKNQMEAENRHLRLRRFRRRLAVAASLLLLLGVSSWSVWNNSRNDLQIIATTEGEMREIRLADGSVVSLNENSRLTISSASNRKVNLEGEAFFEVSRFKGQRFEVTTTYGRISVLGTSFNVRAISSEGATEVAVASGKVAVIGQDERKSVVLGPGNAVSAAADGSLQTLTMPAKNYYAWQSGSLYLKDNTVNETLDLLSRFYGITINYSDSQLVDCAARITGSWQRKHFDAFNAYLLMSTGLELVSNDGTVYQLAGQCQ
jgi:ferric-dicitrate binding protein FerR (iron transport regulator)